MSGVTISKCLWAIGIVLPSLACSSGTLSGGTGGGGGANAGGSSGGRYPDPLALPSCVSDLLSACPPSGSCVYGVTDAGQSSGICFEGGARATTTTVPMQYSCDGPVLTIVTVTKPDGSPCYSVEHYRDQLTDCTQTKWTWKDASGQVVATAGVFLQGTASGQITCAASGEKTSCVEMQPDKLPSGCCWVSDYGGEACPDGVKTLACVPGNCP
jgi:hypothetical protein